MYSFTFSHQSEPIVIAPIVHSSQSLESWASCFWIMHQCGCGLLAWPFSSSHVRREVSHVQPASMFKVSKHGLFCSNNRCCYIGPVIIVQKQSIMLNLRADLALLLWGCKVNFFVLIYQTCKSLLNNQPPSKFIYLGRSPRLLIGVHQHWLKDCTRRHPCLCYIQLN